MVPENFGWLILEAFVDFDANGPGVGDLMGVYEGNPIEIANSTVSNVNLTLDVSMDGKMPMFATWSTLGRNVHVVFAVEYTFFESCSRGTGYGYSKPHILTVI